MVWMLSFTRCDGIASLCEMFLSGAMDTFMKVIFAIRLPIYWRSKKKDNETYCKSVCVGFIIHYLQYTLRIKSSTNKILRFYVNICLTEISLWITNVHTDMCPSYIIDVQFLTIRGTICLSLITTIAVCRQICVSISALCTCLLHGSYFILFLSKFKLMVM